MNETDKKEKKYNAVVVRNGKKLIVGEAKENGKDLAVRVGCFPVDGCFILKEQE